MQTLVYTIGGYCLIKAVFSETGILWAVFADPDLDWGKVFNASGTTAILFLTAIEAFNQ